MKKGKSIGAYQKKALQRLVSPHSRGYTQGLQDMLILMNFQNDGDKPLTIEQAHNRVALSILYN
tara:strand:+ start:107 stop:298 length:192 start_codon:yes stop_codon:yes gene_type:complete